jgi:hypothetical protein
MIKPEDIDWDNPAEVKEYETVIKHKFEAWEAIVKQQFDLVYVGKFTYSDTEEMTPHERKTIYGMLVKQKKDEKEAIDKQRAAAKAK